MADYFPPPGPGTLTGLVDFENFPRVFPGDNFVNYDFNKKTFNFQLPHPDLTLDWVTIPQTSTPEGVNIDLDVRIFNDIITPPGVTVDDVYVQFWDGYPTNPGSIMIGEDTITQILAGQNTTTSIQWLATPPGFHMIYVYVDRDFIDLLGNDNLIPEENENNNMISASITVLDRPDFAINETHIQFDPSDIVVNGTSVTVSVTVHNLGGSTSSVNVTFYDGTETGPGDLIGKTRISVPQKGTAEASVGGWTPIAGPHVVWVYVDEENEVLEKNNNKTNNNATRLMTVLTRPDLIPGLGFDPDSPEYQNTVITLTATIKNAGQWNVTENVEVRFYIDDADNEKNLLTGKSYWIYPDPITKITIQAGKTREVSIQWTAEYPPSRHWFYVRVDYDPNRGGFPQTGLVVESNEANNQFSDYFDVNPRPNLVILPQDIVFSDAYPMNNTAVNIDITIRNTGLSPVLPTDTFYVQIWLDEIGGAGTLLTTIQITGGVPAGGSVFQSYNWPSAVPPGKHEVWVSVDYNNTIGETNETDNKKSATLIIFEVPSDLIVDDNAYWPPFSPSLGTVIIGGLFTIKGFTLVEESGNLTIRNAEYKIIGQRYNDEFTIVVKDTGTLTLEDSILNTEESYHLTIYLFDGATLNIKGSIIDGNIDIIAVDSSNIIISDQSRIKGDIFAYDSTSDVYINATDSTFDKNLQYLGGWTFVELWGVYIAGKAASDDVISVTENAKVYINWYLTVNIVDANDVAIENAVVTWYRSPPWGNSGTKNSDNEGKAYFWLRGMNITTIGVVESIGNYLIKSQFTSPVTTDTYFPDADPTVWMRDNRVETIKFSSVWPELDPPLFVIPDDTIIAVDSPAKVITWINNSGPGNATWVPVTFDDDRVDDPGSPHGWPYTITVPYIAPGESYYIEFQWIPKRIGWHNISVAVDPSKIIIEGDKDNNYNTTLVYVTPRKADLVITNIWYVLDPLNKYGPTENDTIGIHVTIINLGETNAFPSTGHIEVTYRLDDPITGTLIGYGNISGGIPAGQTRESVFPWDKYGQPPTSPPGSYTIFVFVDSDYQVEEGNETNNDASIGITLKKYADVSPKSLEFTVAGSPVTSVPDTTLVTITAIIENTGETNATNVNVRFLDGTQQIGDIQVISLIQVGGGTGTASVVWEATVTGIWEEHSIYVNVSITNENILDNNEFFRDINVTLRPDLRVVDIAFSDNSPEEGQLFTIYASVINSGGTDTATFSVGFYDGDPDANGTTIGVDNVIGGLNVGETGTVSVDWASPIRGSHEIYVVADTQGDINEFNENNNEAHEIIVVYFVSVVGVGDIIVNNTNTPYNISSGGEVYSHRGYTLVEEAGVLTITYTTFQVLEGSDYQFNIIVRNDGTLIIEDGSVLLTNGPLMKIYLYDNAKLYITDSIMDSTMVEIQAFGSANIFISESTINSLIVADQPNANVQLHAENSSLTQPFIYFGGTSHGVFINVTTPEVMISDSAVLEVFRWLKVYVKDGAGTGIELSNVSVSYDPSLIPIPGSPKATDYSGLALFDVMTDVVTSTEWSGPLNYEAFATFNYQGTDYFGGPKKVSFTSYQFDKVNNVKEVTLELSELLPDLMVNATSVKFKDKEGDVRNRVGVGEEITIEATVYNVGKASTTSLTSVLVYFYYGVPQDDRLLGQDIIDTDMPAHVGSGVASLTWIPQKDEEGFNVEIYVVVNPHKTVREVTWTEGDNQAYATVSIVVPPDVSVTSIRFDTAELQNVRNATESQEVTIHVTVKNSGKEDAIDVNVFIYDSYPDFNVDNRPDDPLPPGVDLIDTQNISTISPNTQVTITITWDTAGIEGGFVIYAYALDAEPNGYIADQDLSNNNASKSFTVHPKPDLRFITIQGLNIRPYRLDGTELPGNPEIYRKLLLQARVFNDGHVYIPSVNVSFFEGNLNPENRIGTTFIAVPPTSPKNASVEWSVTGSPGDRTIIVVVNQGQEVLESDPDNNQASQTLTTVYGLITVSFTQDINSKYDLGATIQIIGEAKFSNPVEPMVAVPYTITIFKGTSTHTTYTGNTDSEGRIIRQIPAPNDPGDYSVEIAIDNGGIGSYSDSKEFKAEGEPTNWFLENWLLLLIIIGIGVLVVVLVGVLLGRYGLGRLVECGECGAFIPEGEKKCPKCGAVFEADTAKCSECGAWIPVTSKSCPECGAIFAGIEKEKKDYIERMKGQYAEYVEQYRDEAKKEIGTTMTDEEFLEWWKANPKYVGFEEWLSREEELRKGRTKNCQSCNTVNPESAAICFKCGTVFKKEEEEEEEVPGPPPPEVPPKAVPREVRKAPGAPPTVVPKKVVKPPEVVPKKVVKGPPTVVPKKVMRPPPEGGPPTVVPKKVIKKPLEEEEE